MTNLAISREKKEELIKDYVDELNGSEAIIITGYRGLKVSQVEQLRRKIRDAEGGFAIVKNTLAGRALQDAGLPVHGLKNRSPLCSSACLLQEPSWARLFGGLLFLDENLAQTGFVSGRFGRAFCRRPGCAFFSY